MLRRRLSRLDTDIMTLARYVGPLRGLIGTIGHAVDGGMIINGRTVACRTESPRYEVTRDGMLVASFCDWRIAVLALPGVAPDVAPCAAGIEVTLDGEIWRLTVC